MKKVYLALLWLVISMISQAQVGINTQSPHRLTEFDVKNIVNGTDTIPRGILIPRLRTEQRDQMVISDTDDDNGILIYNIDEDCYNYYSRLENEWQSVCGKLGKAQFTMDCQSIQVHGQYLSNESLDASHYIRIRVEVTKPGAYTVTAVTEPDNGYYFSTSGEFLTTGFFNLILQGAGTPQNHTIAGGEGDLVKFYLDGIDSECSVRIKIEDSSVKPNYIMNCDDVVVNGVYVVNKLLDNTNTITLTLTVDASANGATYIISTNEVDGISFYGTGTLAGGTQTVVLKGSGDPTSFDRKRLIITSNSATSVTTCVAFVDIAYRKMKILGIGRGGDDNFGYNVALPPTGLYPGTYGYGGRKMMNSLYNFGTESYSKIKAEGFDFINGSPVAAVASPTSTQLQNYIDTERPDIIVCAYNWTPDDNSIDILIRYLENKGVVLAFIEAPDAVKRLFNRTLNITSVAAATTAARAAGSIFTFNYIVDSPILNGPFGDVREKNWGEDASNTVCVTGVPTGFVDVYSNGIYRNPASNVLEGSADQISSCKFKNLNLFWCGDGGFWSRQLGAGNYNTICPLNYNANFEPLTKAYGYASSYAVYNSHFFANIMAWAIDLAQNNGYNTPR